MKDLAESIGPLSETCFEVEMTIPTRAEIDPFNTLDGQSACEAFLGVDLVALELAREQLAKLDAVLGNDFVDFKIEDY